MPPDNPVEDQTDMPPRDSEHCRNLFLRVRFSETSDLQNLLRRQFAMPVCFAARGRSTQHTVSVQHVLRSRCPLQIANVIMRAHPIEMIYLRLLLRVRNECLCYGSVHQEVLPNAIYSVIEDVIAVHRAGLSYSFWAEKSSAIADKVTRGFLYNAPPLNWRRIQMHVEWMF